MAPIPSVCLLVQATTKQVFRLERLEIPSNYAWSTNGTALGLFANVCAVEVLHFTAADGKGRLPDEAQLHLLDG